MATGHLNPGYHNSITNLYRTTSKNQPEKPTSNSLTPELANKRWLLTQPNMPEDVLDKIRRDARESWLQIGRSDTNSMTSYFGNYQPKKSDNRIVPRPESPSRRNNPHPSLLFMRCHMHKMKEFSNDYIEKSRPATSSVSRKSSREDDGKKATSRPKTAAVLTSTNGNNSLITNHSSRPSTCLSINKNNSIKSLSQSRPTTSSSNHKLIKSDTITVPPIKSPLSYYPTNQIHPRSFSAQRYSYDNNNNSYNNSKLIYHHKSSRYPRQDYAIHYQWPTTIPHHQLF